MSGYAKGPWRVSKKADVYFIHGADVFFIAELVNNNSAEQEANAHIIAAAPELYEAATDFLKGYCKEPSADFHERMSDLAFRFRIATNKAEGL